MEKSPGSARRDTTYARELASATFVDGDSEIRIERLYVKESGLEEIRFSWWRKGRLIPRPPDLPESQLLPLLGSAISEGVFSKEFLARLKELLSGEPNVS